MQLAKKKLSKRGFKQQTTLYGTLLTFPKNEPSNIQTLATPTEYKQGMRDTVHEPGIQYCQILPQIYVENAIPLE